MIYYMMILGNFAKIPHFYLYFHLYPPADFAFPLQHLFMAV